MGATRPPRSAEVVVCGRPVVSTAPAVWRYTEVPSWTHASPSAVHEDVVWPWLATLPRNSKFTGDVREIVRKFALFCDAGAAGDTDDSGSGSGSDSEDEC